MDEFGVGVFAALAVFVSCSVFYLLNCVAGGKRIITPSVIPPPPRGRGAASGPAPVEHRILPYPGPLSPEEEVMATCLAQMNPHMEALKGQMAVELHLGAQRHELEIVVPAFFREELIGSTVFGLPIRRSAKVGTPQVQRKPSPDPE